MSAECRHCHAPIPPQSGNARRLRHCSLECSKAWWALRARRLRGETERTCAWCQKAFIPKRHDRVRYCSRDCSFRASGERATLKRNELAYTRAWRAAIREDRAKSIAGRMTVKQCTLCGQEFQTALVFVNCAPCRKARASHAPDKTPKPCEECGQVFIPAGTFQRYCSRPCAERKDSRIEKAKRRARELGHSGGIESIDPYAVFMADGWKCRNCGCDTPPGLRGTAEPNAPELDHIVPLSRGGLHTGSNVQTLCRLCNWLKGDKLEGVAA